MIAAFLSSSTSAVQVSPVAQPEELGWTKVGASAATEKVSFTMNLVPRNMKALKARALAASTPGHADYGKFMTTQEIHELTSPTEASVQRVKVVGPTPPMSHRKQANTSTYTISKTK